MEIFVKKCEMYITAYEAFQRLIAHGGEDARSIAFLDSSLTNQYGRYGIVGYRCAIELKDENGQTYYNGQPIKTDFESLLDETLSERKAENPTHLPMIGGAIAYFSYDYGRKFETIASQHPKKIDIPEAIVRFYDIYIIEDIQEQALYIACFDLSDYEHVASILVSEKSMSLPETGQFCHADYKANFTKPDYLKAVQEMIDYIVQGDIYIANMTQTLHIESTRDPIAVYDYLRRHNPAPFGGYLDYGDFQIISASPERFIKIKNGIIETRPIKGTRKRGATPEEDAALKEELKKSGKDQSELLMIVDLERNDLHRICEAKSVAVTELFHVETYATVFHLVSTIVGRLKRGMTFSEILRCIFPGGSITGAPKIRAMEIIDELEHSRRNIYTGSFGYIAADGNCDLNIIIRTLLHHNGQYYLGVGGGITFESDLEFEYEEMLQKAKALLEALGETHDY